MKDTELLPCPFCGGDAEIERPGTSRQSCIVLCTECGCRQESGEIGAGKDWNARAPVVPPAEAADLAMLVRRLVHEVRNTSKDSKLAINAVDYLTRHGLQGSVLRATKPENEIEWKPMDTAPRNGQAIQARIPGHGEDNIIAWAPGIDGCDIVDCNGDICGGWMFVEDQEPPACWTDGYCWASNAAGVPSVQPTAWKTA